MEEKRYSMRKSVLIRIMLFVVIPAIVAVIFYNLNIAKYKDNMTNYPYKEYEYLVEVGNNLFKEKGIININEKPKDVIIEDIEKQGENYICKLMLNNNKDDKYIPNVRVTAQLSEDFEIISLDYFLEEEYAQVIGIRIKESAWNVGGIILTVELVILAVYCLYRLAKIEKTK